MQRSSRTPTVLTDARATPQVCPPATILGATLQGAALPSVGTHERLGTRLDAALSDREDAVGASASGRGEAEDGQPKVGELDVPVRVDEDLLTGAAGVKRRRPERGVPVREEEGTFSGLRSR